MQILGLKKECKLICMNARANVSQGTTISCIMPSQKCCGLFKRSYYITLISSVLLEMFDYKCWHYVHGTHCFLRLKILISWL